VDLKQQNLALANQLEQAEQDARNQQAQLQRFANQLEEDARNQQAQYRALQRELANQREQAERNQAQLQRELAKQRKQADQQAQHQAQLQPELANQRELAEQNAQNQQAQLQAQLQNEAVADANARAGAARAQPEAADTVAFPNDFRFRRCPYMMFNHMLDECSDEFFEWILKSQHFKQEWDSTEELREEYEIVEDKADLRSYHRDFDEVDLLRLVQIMFKVGNQLIREGNTHVGQYDMAQELIQAWNALNASMK